MSWKIKNVEIENFKFFKDVFSINVDSKNILLYGENGAGKSSIYWSVYTHFQAYAKKQQEAQKYFTANHAQNLRNRYAAADDDSAIRISPFYFTTHIIYLCLYVKWRHFTSSNKNQQKS